MKNCYFSEKNNDDDDIMWYLINVTVGFIQYIIH